MKATLDIQDGLMIRAKQLSARTGRPLRALVEDGLRQVLARTESDNDYELPDYSVGNPNDTNPLEALTWKELRA